MRAAAGQGPLSLGMLCEFVGILRKRLLAKEPRASSFVKARFQPVVSRHRGEHLPTAALLASQALQRWLQHFRAEYRNPLAHGESIPVTGRSYRKFCAEAWAAPSVEAFLSGGVSPKLVKDERPGWASVLQSSTRLRK